MTRIGSLFSGYGGLDLGVRMALGGTVAWHCENDPAAARILTHHHPDTPNLGDITTIDWDAVPRVDILTGGFPCQDLSHAGTRAGLEGARSGLWAHMARAIQHLQPRTVVIENVRGLLSAEAASDLERDCWCVGDERDTHLRALGAVLGDLADLRYDAQWVTVPASAVGAPHRRERVFITAHPDDDGCSDRAGSSRAAEPPFPRSGGIEPTPPADADHAGLEGRPPHIERPGQQPPRAGGVGPQLLKTPTAQLAVNGGSQHPHKRKAGGHGPTLADEVEHLLPTPLSIPDSPASHGQISGRFRAAMTAALLPTPVVNDMGAGKTPEAWDEWRADMQARHGNGHGPSLAIEVQRFGQYAPAIQRWEAVLHRPAPPPTQPGRTGPVLSPPFVEWLMGLPEGFITHPDIGLTRPQQLKALGNGVVPQQAAHALTLIETRTTQ